MPASFSLSERLYLARLIAGYRLRFAAKQVTARFAPSLARPWPAGDEPRVTVLVTSLNQRDSLEATLRTLRARAGYSNYEIVVADHGSTDGSPELLDRLVSEGWPLRVIQHGRRRPQHEWYDFMLHESEADFWVGVHEDMLFLADGWLSDLVAYMTAHPDVELLGGEFFPPVPDYVEPVEGTVVALQESLSTWVFCARRSLRERVRSSFAYSVHEGAPGEHPRLFDQGGQIIDDLRAGGGGFACMPAWYTRKFLHIGNLSWVFETNTSSVWQAFKRYQVNDASRRLAQYA